MAFQQGSGSEGGSTEGTLSPANHSRGDDFGELITRYGSSFVGREWLVERVDSFLAEKKHRTLVLSGGPGIGKTAFLAHLAERNPRWLRYFIRRDSREFLRPADARTFLLAVGVQLAEQRPELFETDPLKVRQQIGSVESGGEVVGAEVAEVKVSPFAKLALEVQQEVGTVQGRVLGLKVGKLEAEARNLSMQDLQHLALVDPARRLATFEPEAEIVVLVDALDEVRFSPAAGTENPDIIRALRELPEAPKNLRFIVSSRPEPALDRLLNRSDVRVLELEPLTDQNLADLRSLAGSVLAAPQVHRYLDQAGENPQDLAEAVLEKSAGNFLYLVKVLNVIRQASEETSGRGAVGLAAVADLPGDLPGLYRHFLGGIIEACRQRMGEAAWGTALRPLLGTLTVAREPLGPARLALLSGLEIEAVSDLLRELRQFVDTTDRQEPAYRFYHSSFGDFLSDPDLNGEYFIDPEAAHGRVSEKILVSWGDLSDGLPGLEPAREESGHGYGLRFLPLHLELGGQTASLTELLKTPRFLAAKISAGLVFPLVRDLEQAIRVRSAEGQEGTLLELLKDELERDAMWLLSHPEDALNQLYHQLNRRPAPPDSARAFAEERVRPLLGGAGRPFLRLLHGRSPSAGERLPSSEEYSFRHRAPAIVLGDGRCVIGSTSRQNRGMLEVWERRSGLARLSLDIEGDPQVLAPLSGDEVVVVADKLAEDHDGWRNSIYIFDLAAETCRRVGAFHSSLVLAAAVVEGGLFLVTRAGERYCATLASGQVEKTGALDHRLTAATIDAQGRILYVRDTSKSELSSEDPAAELREYLRPHPICVWRPRALESEEIACFQLPLSALSSGSLSGEHPGLVQKLSALVQISPERIVLAGEAGSVILLDLPSQTFFSLFHHSSAVGSLAVHPDGRLLICGTDAVLRDLGGKDARSGAPTVPRLEALASLPDGQVLAFGDSRVRVFNPANNSLQPVARTRFGRPLSAATALASGIVAETSLLDGWAVAEDLAGHISILGRLKTSLAAADAAGRVYFPSHNGAGRIFKLWDSKTGETTDLPIPPLSLREFPDRLSSFSVLSDGRFVLGGGSGGVWLLDPAVGSAEKVGSLGGAIQGLGEIRPGVLALCSESGTVALWDLEDGARSQICLQGRPVALACGGDQPHLTVGLSDGVLVSFTVESADAGGPEKVTEPSTRKWRYPWLPPLERRQIWYKPLISSLKWVGAILVLSIGLGLGQGDLEWKLLPPAALTLFSALFVAGTVVRLLMGLLAGARIRRLLRRNARVAGRETDRPSQASQAVPAQEIDLRRLTPIEMSRGKVSQVSLLKEAILFRFIGDKARRRRLRIPFAISGFGILAAAFFLFPGARAWILGGLSALAGTWALARVFGSRWSMWP